MRPLEPDGESREEPEEHKRECLDGLARITSKELATTRSVKSGTLQNACSTRPRVVVGLGKSARSHIVKLMNSRRKGPKRVMTKSAVAMLKKGDWQEREPVTENVTIDRETWEEEVIRNWDKIHLNDNLLMHGNWGLRISGHDAAEVYSPEGH